MTHPFPYYSSRYSSFNKMAWGWPVPESITAETSRISNSAFRTEFLFAGWLCQSHLKPHEPIGIHREQAKNLAHLISCDPSITGWFYYKSAANHCKASYCG